MIVVMQKRTNSERMDLPNFELLIDPFESTEDAKHRKEVVWDTELRDFRLLSRLKTNHWNSSKIADKIRQK